LNPKLKIQKREKMSKSFHFFWVTGFILLLGFISSCKTKGEIRREQEMERLKSDVREARGIKADLDTTVEELKIEVARLSSGTNEQSALYRNQIDELKTEVMTLQTRLQALEQRAVSEDLALKTQREQQVQQEALPKTFDSGKKLYDEGKFEDSLLVLREVLQKSKKNTEESKKTQFLIGEVLFSSKDYASAALEFAEFQKNYPKDKRVPNAIYRQAWSFKNLGKNKEARLFFEELIKTYPKHGLVARAKRDLKNTED